MKIKKTLKISTNIRGILIAAGVILSCMTMASAQTVTGTVTSDGMPMPGTTVLVEGTATGVVTDFDGMYSIDASPDANLIFSYVGFETQKVSVNGRTKVDVVLKEEGQMLDEIVVVGYGTQKKESVVAAISQVKGDVLMERAAGIANVEEALQGNLPGVTAIQGSGTPGESDMKITIRGLSSWNGDGGPLILVDGVKRSMSDIDMNDIENLSVLKDASATAVFGVEGANGVILVTTKRGKVGKAQLSLSVNSTIKMVSQLPEKLSSYEGIYHANRAIEREVAVIDTWGGYTPLAIMEKYRNPANEEESYIYPNVDWEDQLLKDFAQDLRVNLSVRGGNKSAKYFGSLAYQTVNDIFDGGKHDNGRGYKGEFNYQRFNYRSNIDFNITSTTEFSVNLSGFLGVQQKPTAVNRVTNALYQIAPSLYTPVYDDGYYGLSANPANIFQNSVVNLSASGYDTFTNFQVNTDFILKQKLDFITKGLSFKGRFSLDNNMRSKQSLTDGAVEYRIYDDGEEILRSPNGVNDFDYVQAPWRLGASNVENNQRERQMVYDFSLNYKTMIADKHSLSALFLMRRQQNAKGSQFPRYREDWVARIEYNYDMRYFLDVNGAYNGSEKFGPGYRFDLFPSVAGGWTISNEAFLEDSDWLDKLKVRGSYGIVGDDNSSGRFLYQTQWASGQSAYLVPSNYTGRSPYNFYREKSVGNPDLQWETSANTNVGVELSIFQGLFTAEVDYFVKNRDNIVIPGLQRSVPDWFGASPPDFNYGIVEVKGYEIVLGANHTFDNGLNLYGNYYLTQAKDLVVRKDDPAFEPAYLNDAGYRIGQSRTAIPGEILTSWDDIYMSTPQTNFQNLTRVGYYDVVDFDGDGIYNDQFDQAPFGYASTPQRTWSATFGARYKGWNVSAQLYGTQNASRRFSNQTFTQESPLVFSQDIDYWSKETPNNTNTLAGFRANGDVNPRRNWLDNSLTRLKAVSVSYDFSKNVCEKIGLNSLQLFVNGNNLALWSNMPDDREFNSGSAAQSQGAYPTLKRFNFGFNMNF